MSAVLNIKPQIHSQTLRNFEVDRSNYYCLFYFQNYFSFLFRASLSNLVSPSLTVFLEQNCCIKTFEMFFIEKKKKKKKD